MEAPALMNNRYPMAQGSMQQQKQPQPGLAMQSNNIKQFGAGSQGPMVPRPMYNAPPTVGQKRDSSTFDAGQGASQASINGGNFVKLFVGHVPRTATEDDIQQLFADYGHVLEVSLVKEKRVGQQHGCCFIKYAMVEEAERAIKALHNQYTLPGGISPLQVRHADGEREQLVEHKLFVGSLNKQATEKEIEEIFAKFGTVDDIYIMRDEQKQSRGCAFVKYPSREMAAAAINALNGIYVMRGCNQPLAVRFAEPKRPKVGDARSGPAFGGPGFGTELQRPFGSRPTLGVGGHMGGRGVPTNWRPPGMANMRTPSPQVGHHPYGSSASPSARGASVGGPSPLGGPMSGSGSSVNGPPIQGPVQNAAPMGGPGRMSTPSQQPGFSSPTAQRQTQAHGWLQSVQQPRQMQQQLQPPLQHQHSQPPQSHTQLQSPQQSIQQYGQQLQTSQPLAQQPTAFGQVPASQQPLSLYGQLPVSQPQVQRHVAPSIQQVPPSTPLQPQTHQQQLQPQAQQQPHLQIVQQQPSVIQSNFPSQQHPSFPQQLQQPLMQAATQSQQQPVPVQPQQQQAYYQVAPVQHSAQQQPWTYSVQPQAVVNTGSSGPVSVATEPITAVAVTPASAPAPAPITCVWSEHTSPEGYKYYYNSVTGESTWEKPDELTVFEQQQQQQQTQQPHLQSQPQPQPQPQPQLQSQLQPQQQQQSQLQSQPQLQSFQQQQAQIPQPTMSTNLGYGQLQGPNATLNVPRQYAQQTMAVTQDWMWKARPGGT